MAIIPRTVRIGLSAGRTQQPPRSGVTLGDLAAGGRRPVDVIDESMDTAATGTLRYPTDIGQYWMLLEINRYDRESWLDVGELSLLGSIALPLPIQVVDHASVDWEVENLGQVAGQVYNAFAGDFSPGGIGGAAAIGGLFPGGVPRPVTAATQALGYAINQYLTVMLKGPNYKHHQFSWMFSPNSADESRTVSLIKSAIDNAKAPGIAPYAGATFFTWPHVITMAFMHESADMGARLYRFKPCVIEEVTFDFTGQTNPQPAFYGETKAPESMKMTIKFMELEFWLQGDPMMSGEW